MQNRKTQKHWEKTGKSYNVFWKSKAKQGLNIKELGFINKHLEKTVGQYVLDIGVGSGRIIENYLNNPKIKEVYGIDWAEAMVNFCRNKFKNEKKVQKIVDCNISKDRLPFKRKFDFISAIRVLKYNQNWQKIIGKSINSLSRSGSFVFTMPNKNSFLSFTRPETSIYYTTLNELKEVISKQNGEIIQINSFIKLPDVFYDIFDNKLYVSALLGFERLSRRILGDTFLGRIFIVAVKRPNRN